MSDLEDFVTKPKKIKTYKRRKKTAPLDIPRSDYELKVEDVCKELFKSSKKDKLNDICIKSQYANNRLYPEKCEEKATDLENFLANSSRIPLPGYITQESINLFNETELVIENDENASPPPKKMLQADIVSSPSRTKQERSENINSLKAAANMLCNKNTNKSLKQSTLVNIIKRDSRNSKEEKGDKSGMTKIDTICANVSDKPSPPSSTEGRSNKLPIVKKLIKQEGTNQLDLGSMFGLKAKQPGIKKLVKQGSTNQLDLGAMFGMKPKQPDPPKETQKPSNKWSSTNKDGTNKKVPFYKWVSGTTFVVDGFNYGDMPNCTAYFLTHFHADHYMGLSKNFNSVVYCSKITSNYVINNLKVEPERVKTLEFDKTYKIQDIEVTLLTANHCPGSAMFLFSSPKIGNILHTGDFRFHKTMLEHKALTNKVFSYVYLDTTYFNSEYSFPSQTDVIKFMVNKAEGFSRQTLVVCGSYTIGKERIVQSIAEQLDCKICVNQTKMKLIEYQENCQLYKRLVKAKSAQLHIVKMKDINEGSLANLLAQIPDYTEVVGIKPTGWTNKQNTNLTDIKPVCTGKVKIYNVPYSEHSSYTELETFVKSIRVKKIISTVLPRTKEGREFMFEKLKLWTQDDIKPNSSRNS